MGVNCELRKIDCHYQPIIDSLQLRIFSLIFTSTDIPKEQLILATLKLTWLYDPQVKCQEINTGQAIFHKNISDVDAVISGQGVESNTEYIVSVTPQTSQGNQCSCRGNQCSCHGNQ